MGKLGVKMDGKSTGARSKTETLQAPLHEVVTGDVKKPLLPESVSVGGTRQRVKKVDIPRYQPDDWDDSLPYGGKVYLARKKKPDTWICILLQVFVVSAAVGLIYYAWYHSDHMHFHLSKAYAHLGHKEAQATVGHKLLNGVGVETNMTAAMEWFKKAADQGHPQASYNVAVGHLRGHRHTGLKPGDAHKLIQHAASQGVPEAEEVLKNICSRGYCDE